MQDPMHRKQQDIEILSIHCMFPIQTVYKKISQFPKFFFFQCLTSLQTKQPKENHIRYKNALANDNKQETANLND